MRTSEDIVLERLASHCIQVFQGRMCLVDAAVGTPTVSPSEDTRKLSLAVIIE
jgi:hypothetical protein